MTQRDFHMCISPATARAERNSQHQIHNRHQRRSRNAKGGDVMFGIQSTVSATVGLVCLVAAGLFWTVGKRHTPRLVVALIITGMVGILGTPIGEWIRRAVGWVDEFTGTITGRLTGTVVVGLVALVAMYVVVVHVWRHRVSGQTLVAAGVVPVAMTTIPGVLGSVAASVVGALAGAVGWAISAAFGWV